MASSSSSSQWKYQVFLSFRGEDTRLNFTSHLLKVLKDTGINVFFDEEALEKGEQIWQALSQAIAASNLSIVVLSVGYASSKSCLAELSDIMWRKGTQEHTVLPIFYHVDPSDVRNLKGSFKTSFEDHESNRPVDEVKRWKAAFVEIGKLKGWHIKGGIDRSDSEYIKDVVQYVIEKLNGMSKSVYEEWVGIDDQKKTILKLVEHRDSRVIGLWGMGGIGKTTLAEAVYNEISQTFQDRYFLQDFREKIEKQGKESLRNKFFSKLLKSEICIDTLSLGSTLIQRLKNLKAIIVFDDVNDSDQIEFMGVRYLGDGSKIIITSRDKQVLRNGGADKIHEVKGLNKNNSLQLFFTCAFKLLKPAPEFLNLSDNFLEYAQGSPLALKVLGSKLYKKCREVWESEVDKLNEYPQQKIIHILRRSFNDLDKSEKNIFLDIACLLKGESEDDVKKILSCLYKGAVCGISNLRDKCLLHIDSNKQISMHDLLEEMGKDIVHEESEDPGKRSRLWSFTDVNQVFEYNKVNRSIEAIKLVTTFDEVLLLCRHGFEKMYNLRSIHIYTWALIESYPDGIESVPLPDGLRCLNWTDFPLKYLSQHFNPKNLVVLRLQFGSMEELWSEDHKDLVNLRVLDIYCCERLKKIPDLSGAINLQSLDCRNCISLVQLPCLNHLTSLKELRFRGCYNLNKFPELPDYFSELDLSKTKIEEVPDSIQHLVRLRSLNLRGSSVKTVSSNLSNLESLRFLDFSDCKSLETLPQLPRYLQRLNPTGCTSLENVSFTEDNFDSFLPLHDGDDASEHEFVRMIFANCRSLSQDSIESIVANAMLQIQSVAEMWAKRKWISREEYRGDFFGNKLSYCFPGNEVPADVFYCGSKQNRLAFNKTSDGCSKSRFFAFAVCLVADSTHLHGDFLCEYELKDASGGTFIGASQIANSSQGWQGEHVLILFDRDMMITDRDYIELNFEFKIGNDFPETIEVEKCGVYPFYMDAECEVIRPRNKRKREN